MEYRNLEKNDRLQYINLMRNFRPLDEQMTDRKFEEIYEKIFNRGNIIVCQIDKKIVGSITIILEYKFINNYAIYAHIEDVFVDENFRHKNIGTDLIKEATRYCERKNVFKISLNCKEELKKFYSLNGFEQRQINMSKLLLL